jgi:hypothetical protein
MYVIYVTNMRKTVDFTPRALEIIEYIQKEEGHKTFSSALLAIIAGYYLKVWYTKHKGGGTGKESDPASKEYTAEEVAEAYVRKYGGKMEPEKDGALIQIGAVKMFQPFLDSGTKMLAEINLWRSKAAQQTITFSEFMEPE